MNKRYKELLKNTGLLTVSNFSSKILIFLLVPIYTRVLLKSEYGFYDLVYTSMQLLFPLLTVGISDGAMRFLMDADYDKKEIVSIGVKYLIFSMLGVTAILLVNAYLTISPILKSYTGYIALFYTAYAIYSLEGPLLKGLNKVRIIAISGVLGTIAMIMSNLVFLLVFKLGLKGFFAANIIGQIVPTVYIAIRDKQWQYLKIPHNSQLEKKMIAYALPLVVSTIGWWANNTSDRYIVSYMCGVDTNGLLSVAYKIPSFISVFGGIFLQAWQISAIKEYQEKENSVIYKDLFLNLNGILAIAAGGLIILAHGIAIIMFGNFVEGWIFIPMLIISALMNQASGFIGPILSAKMNTNAMAVSGGIGIVMNIILNIALTLIMGPIGVTFATAFSSFLIFYFRERATDGEVRSERYMSILLSWALLVVESVVIVYLENYFIAASIFGVIIALYGKTLYTTLSRILHFRRKIG